MTTTVIVTTAALIGFVALVSFTADTYDRHQQSQNRALRAKVAALEATVAELDQENMRLHMEVVEAQIASGKVRVPWLTVVKP